jgi:parvulin-like peptidyl-prolyl isomerase
VKDSGIAHELYLQLEAAETSFEKLATNYSEGPEQRSGGKVGPAPISRAHPQLQQLLRAAPIGVVLEPIAIEQWWVVTRLDERMEASFDDAMRQRMATELLEEWITTETNHLVKAVCNRENGQ